MGVQEFRQTVWVFRVWAFKSVGKHLQVNMSDGAVEHIDIPFDAGSRKVLYAPPGLGFWGLGSRHISGLSEFFRSRYGFCFTEFLRL